MINIIPKPYNLIDYEKRIRVNGFNYDCPNELGLGLEIFKEEFNNGDLRVVVVYKKYSNDDAYSLKVTKKEIVIEAGNAKAVFYATRSLKQLIETKKDYYYIQCCEIFD